MLDNGAVLPSGLLSVEASDLMDGFKKSYQNPFLRIGIIKDCYDIDSKSNISKKVPEYDVLVFEQNGSGGSTVITYKNCVAAGAFGSIADFFEAKLRKLEKKKTKGATPTPAGQDGAIVLLLCLNGVSDQGIIVSTLLHPDRKTKLKPKDLHLEGEYNGLNVKVDKDGAATMIFNGATDNQGKPKDKDAGPTTVKIEKDGSFQLEHKTIKIRLDKKGDVTLKAKGDIKIDCENATVTATKNLTAKCKEAIIEASGKATIEGKDVYLGKGASEAIIKGDAFKKIFDAHMHPTAVGPSGPPVSPMPPSTLSKISKTE